MKVERGELWWPGPLLAVGIGLVLLWALGATPARAQVSPDGPIFTNPALMCSVGIQGGAFSTAAGDWTSSSGGASPPAVTITSNAGAGPPASCSTAALRLQVGATSASVYGGISIGTPPSYTGTQMCSGGTSNISWAFWANATTTTTLDLCANDNSHGWQCSTCALTANTWTFCKVQSQLWWLNTNVFLIGNLSLLNGGTARSALDVQLYAPRCVVAATISS